AATSSASLAPRHPRRRREVAALPHCSVENVHTTRHVGGWDSIRVDKGPIRGGVREVLHAVVAYALGELEARLPLLGRHLATREPRRLQIPTRAEGLLERRGAGVQRRAVRPRFDGQLTR